METAMQAIANGAPIDQSLKVAQDTTNQALTAYNAANHLKK